MKAVTVTLYICGGLMATAAVMGAIDYQVAQHNGKLKSLYKDEKPMTVGTKTIEIDDYSRGPIPPPAPKTSPNNIQGNVKKEGRTTSVINETKATSLVKKKKRIKFSEFSRAALPVKFGVDGETVKVTMDSTEKKAWDY